MGRLFFARGFVAGDYGGRYKINELVFGISEQQIQFFKALIEKHNIQTVLDVACGNGDLAVLLSMWGKSVTVLITDPFLNNELCSKSSKAGIRFDICFGDMRDLSSVYRKQCDLITCLRNSLSKLLKEEDIWGTLAQMYLKLEPGGILVVHTLNYDRLLASCKYPVTVLHEHNGGLSIKLLFKPAKGGESAKLILQSFSSVHIVETKNEVVIPVRPILKKELNLWLAELGFERIENYGSFDWTAYNNNSCDRITVAYRPGPTNV